MSTLKDLNKHLFEQLDRLSNAKSENLDIEVQRATTMQVISAEIIKAHNTQLEAVKLVAQYKGLNPNQEAPKIETGNIEV
ncbi:hypothetical protein [uncultured Acinetobacter sp.]|jgi:hypothetical protein|uniref:hypothetical protein n=1 Tax=uncultured Acinetobacter sp. TaxID=165433 RepID=UPI0025F1E5AB|nr:hypothetical protein [uncultured Acinetobacter sp.]